MSDKFIFLTVGVVMMSMLLITLYNIQPVFIEDNSEYGHVVEGLKLLFVVYNGPDASDNINNRTYYYEYSSTSNGWRVWEYKEFDKYPPGEYGIVNYIDVMNFLSSLKNMTEGD